ncbi:glycosyltransferase family 2 protein [Pedobacter sp. PWIIR3]
MVEEEIKLSIALVTRNRPDSLRKTLESLAQQDYKPYEIIISDDSSEILSKEKNIRLCVEFGCKYLDGPHNGLYANRNFVAKQCTGTHIRTMDDDHLFPKGHLKACIDSIIQFPSTILTIGEYISDHDEDRVKPYPIPGQLHPRGYSYYPFEGSTEAYYGISCGATIYPYKLIDDGIYNAEFYKFGTLYLEYGARLRYLGYDIQILKDTYIIHNDATTTANSLNPATIVEANIFSILCLSLIYRPTVKNRFLTLSQILKFVVTRKVNINGIGNAYNNYLKMKNSLK